MTLGERIKAARKPIGLTQKQLAEKIGVATGTIQQYELNKRQPRMGQLKKIADVLEVSIAELLGNEKGSLAHYLETGDKESAWRRQMNMAFDELSEHGQCEAVKRVKELTYIPEYKKP